MDNPLEAIKKRRSVRTFHPGPLGPAELDRLQGALPGEKDGAFRQPGTLPAAGLEPGFRGKSAAVWERTG